MLMCLPFNWCLRTKSRGAYRQLLTDSARTSTLDRDLRLKVFLETSISKQHGSDLSDSSNRYYAVTNLDCKSVLVQLRLIGGVDSGQPLERVQKMAAWELADIVALYRSWHRRN